VGPGKRKELIASQRQNTCLQGIKGAAHFRAHEMMRKRIGVHAFIVDG
jgi:hypothetical protein